MNIVMFVFETIDLTLIPEEARTQFYVKKIDVPPEI